MMSVDKEKNSQVDQYLDNKLQRNADEDTPSWLHPRPKCVEDAYGVVGRPLLAKSCHIRLNTVITGGWSGLKVELPTALEHDRMGSLWLIPELGKPKGQIRSGTKEHHGWMFPIGLPWYIGQHTLPTELLMFLACKAKEEMLDTFDNASEPIAELLLQFQPRDGNGLCVQAAMLTYRHPVADENTNFSNCLDARRNGHRRNIELFDFVVTSTYRGVSGIFVACGCNKPGSLQCSTYCRIVEDIINEAIGGDKYSRLQIVACVDGLTFRTLCIVSGQEFHWNYKLPGESSVVPKNMIGERFIKEWNVTSY